MCKLSVIIPVYKTREELFKDCVKSVLDQGTKDLSVELILVDDGCPETSGRYCDSMTGINANGENRNQVKVIHQENGGPAAARNAGLALATGDYITFVDADDKLKPGIYRSAISLLAKNPACNALIFGFEQITGNGIKKHPVANRTRTTSWEEVFDTIAGHNFNCGGGYPWNKIFRASALKKKNDGQLPIYVTELFAYEDKLWCLEAFFELGDVILYDGCGYIYKNDENSTSNGQEAELRRKTNVYLAFEKMEEYILKTRPSAVTGLRTHLFKILFTDLRRDKQDELTISKMKEVLARLSLPDFKRLRDMAAFLYCKMKF